jgi:hypothetical protein
VSASVHPFQRPDPEPDARTSDSATGEVHILQPWPRITPGIYEAVSKTLTTRTAFQRRFVEALFDVFDGPVTNGRQLARVPGFFPIPNRARLARSSSLARWIALADIARRDRIPLRTLEHKAWKVRIVDVTTSHLTETVNGERRRRILPTPLIYSKVAEVLERL